MSTTGVELFDDDLAGDVRDIYRRLLQDRVPDDEASRRMIEDWSDLASDEEPVFWLALAATQSDLGRLEEHVRQRALQVIDTGADLDLRRPAGDEWVTARAAVLDALRAQLTGAQPSRKAMRRPWRHVTDLTAGTVLARTRNDGVVVVLRVVTTIADLFTGAVRPVLQRLDWSGRELPPAELLDSLPVGPSVGPRGWDEPKERRAACVAYRVKKRDPDWLDMGFVVCGTAAPRDGDDGNWDERIMFIPWDGLVRELEHD